MPIKQRTDLCCHMARADLDRHAYSLLQQLLTVRSQHFLTLDEAFNYVIVQTKIRIEEVKQEETDDRDQQPYDSMTNEPQT